MLFLTHSIAQYSSPSSIEAPLCGPGEGEAAARGVAGEDEARRLAADFEASRVREADVVEGLRDAHVRRPPILGQGHDEPGQHKQVLQTVSHVREA